MRKRSVLNLERKREEGRRKREEGRRKREEGRGNVLSFKPGLSIFQVCVCVCVCVCLHMCVSLRVYLWFLSAGVLRSLGDGYQWERL